MGTALILAATDASAQGLRFGNHREVRPPDYATLMIGPFYSTIEFSQSAGYKYTRSKGTGTDFLYANRRGVTIEDGGEFPLTTRLDLRNYLMISRSTDLDMSIGISYDHFPLGTQEDQFNVLLVDEGIYGSFSMGVMLSPFCKGTAYDKMVYRTDYIDTRGIEDPYGGQQYEYFRNTIGLDMDWLMAMNHNLGLSLSREDEVPHDEDEYGIQERVSYREALIYEYALYSGLVLGAGATYTQTDYTDPTRQDTRREDYSAFLRFGEDADIPLTGVSVLSLRAGYSQGYHWSPPVADESESATVSGAASLRTQLRRNLSHKLGYSRTLRGGFNSAFEQVDAYDYRIEWKGAASSVTLHSALKEVEPSSDSVNAYRDWSSGLEVSYPLRPYINLQFSSKYSVRQNRDTVEGDEEWVYDYDTWSTRLGTSFAVTRKIDFTTYVQHVERYSNSEQLEYERDTISGVFTFRHRF